MTDLQTAAGGSPRVASAAPAASLRATGRYLTFSLGGELYAFDILVVTEIIAYRPVTTVPMVPPFIRGVINLRGRVLPVIDLMARFGQGSPDVARRTSIVVVHDGEADGTGIGIMVDAVNKVVHLADEDVQPPPAFGAGVRSDFIAGMARHEDQFVIVLDIEKVLPFEEVAALTGDQEPLT